MGAASHFPRLVSVLRELPAKSAILDGEIVASDAAGMPDFWRLFLRSAKPAELHVWAFDLLERQGSAEVVPRSPPGAPAGPPAYRCVAAWRECPVLSDDIAQTFLFTSTAEHVRSTSDN
jgi:hypothetical protein